MNYKRGLMFTLISGFFLTYEYVKLIRIDRLEKLQELDYVKIRKNENNINELINTNKRLKKRLNTKTI